MPIKFHDNMHGPQYDAEGRTTDNWDALKDYGTELCKVFFRIDCPSYDPYRGFSSEQEKSIFHNEAHSVISAFGLEESSGYEQDKPYLYAHPHHLSGVVYKNSVFAIAKALNEAESFSVRWVDIYEDVFIMSAEEYRAALLDQENEIKADILRAFQTKRSNLYIPCQNLYDPACQKLMSKYHIHRLSKSNTNSCMDGVFSQVFFEFLDQLVSFGLLIEAETKSGKAYRAAKTEYVSGVLCAVNSERMGDGKKHDVYTFTVPGWEKCSVTGKAAAKRMIDARLSPAVCYLYGKA